MENDQPVTDSTSTGPQPQPSDDFKKLGSSNSFNSYEPTIATKKNGSSKPIIIILSLVVILLIGGAGYLLRDKFIPKSAAPEPSPSPVTNLETPIAVPSPSPVVRIDRSKFMIRILNGTSKAGLAASASAKLKDLGYSIEKTGNATNSAFTRTTIRVKATGVDLLAQLIKDLAPDYDASGSASLKDQDTADAEVILGTR